LEGGAEVGREGEKLFHRDRTLLQAILKFSNLEQSYWLLVVGGSLVLNAALFRFLLRRTRQLFPFADNADAIYLYSIGALLPRQRSMQARLASRGTRPPLAIE
jgi:hypothetical protein